MLSEEPTVYKMLWRNQGLFWNKQIEQEERLSRFVLLAWELLRGV